MNSQTMEARYVKKSVLERFLSNIFQPGYTIEVTPSRP